MQGATVESNAGGGAAGVDVGVPRRLCEEGFLHRLLGIAGYSVLTTRTRAAGLLRSVRIME